MEDTLQLIEEVHRRGMRIVFDMVMNHTSEEHPWFKESRSSRDNPKADWYIWRDQPNNWNSITGGSGWHHSKERGQYYWSSFLPFQPDLNYWNPEVKKTMLDIVRFWLSKGVDGFRLDIFNVIYKDAEFRDNPLSFKLLPREDDPSGFFQEAKYNLNRPESFGLARELRSVCEEFGEKILLGEAGTGREVLRKFLGRDANDGLGLMFDFEMLNFKFRADYFRDLIKNTESTFPNPFMPVYVFSNHDQRRSITRMGGDVRKAKLLHTLQLTVRGVPCMYYGEEIGMADHQLPFGTALDPIPHKFKFIPRFVFEMLGLTINRDEVRTPMHWNGTRNAGFSSAHKTWLPVHENHSTVNVEKESNDSSSLLNTIRELLGIRREEKSLQEGSLEFVQGLPDGVLGFSRVLGRERINIFLNFSESNFTFNSQQGTCLFQLSGLDRVENASVRLGGFGGVLLKSVKDAG